MIRLECVRCGFELACDAGRRGELPDTLIVRVK